MLSDRDEYVLSAFVNLIGENARLFPPLPQLPEILLPEKRLELRNIVNSSDSPIKDQLLNALDYFIPEGGGGELVSRLTTAPFLLMLAYTVSIAFAGGSILWVVICVLGWFGIAGSLIVLLSGKLTSRSSKHSLLIFLFYDSIWAIGFFSFGALWIRLVFYTGLYGIYEAASPPFNLGNLLLSLFALIVGYFYSKQLNSIHFFSYEHPKKSILSNRYSRFT